MFTDLERRLIYLRYQNRLMNWGMSKLRYEYTEYSDSDYEIFHSIVESHPEDEIYNPKILTLQKELEERQKELEENNIFDELPF